MSKTTEPFGYLLAIDIYNVDPVLLDDMSLCEKFLKDLTAFLKMEAQCEPIIMKGDTELYPIKGTGLSAWIPLIESGIQFHSISAKKFLSIDIYSCKEFNPQPTAEWVWNFYRPKSVFNAEDIDIQFIPRGLKYHVL